MSLIVNFAQSRKMLDKIFISLSKPHHILASPKASCRSHFALERFSSIDLSQSKTAAEPNSSSLGYNFG